MAMSDRTYNRQLRPLLDRFHTLESAGIISGFQCWSPKDTLDDTRFSFDQRAGVFHFNEAEIVLIVLESESSLRIEYDTGQKCYSCGHYDMHPCPTDGCNLSVCINCDNGTHEHEES